MKPALGVGPAWVQSDRQARRPYHALVGFEGQNRGYGAAELRPGDAHMALGAVELPAACFARLPPDTRRIDVRKDKGFYEGNIVAAREDRRASFVLVARSAATPTTPRPVRLLATA